MKIVHKAVHEEIVVLHNDEEEMTRNVEELKKQGWSGNIRKSVVGIPLVISPIYDVEEFKKKFPDVRIHSGDGATYNSYVYLTEHHRELEEGQNDVQA